MWATASANVANERSYSIQICVAITRCAGCRSPFSRIDELPHPQRGVLPELRRERVDIEKALSSDRELQIVNRAERESAPPRASRCPRA